MNDDDKTMKLICFALIEIKIWHRADRYPLVYTMLFYFLFFGKCNAFISKIFDFTLDKKKQTILGEKKVKTFLITIFCWCDEWNRISKEIENSYEINFLSFEWIFSSSQQKWNYSLKSFSFSISEPSRCAHGSMNIINFFSTLHLSWSLGTFWSIGTWWTKSLRWMPRHAYIRIKLKWSEISKPWTIMDDTRLRVPEVSFSFILFIEFLFEVVEFFFDTFCPFEAVHEILYSLPFII